jgi:hypothetical protein
MTDWPAAITETALHGPAGEFVLRTEPHSDPGVEFGVPERATVR